MAAYPHARRALGSVERFRGKSGTQQSNGRDEVVFSVRRRHPETNRCFNGGCRSFAWL